MRRPTCRRRCRRCDLRCGAEGRAGSRTAERRHPPRTGHACSDRRDHRRAAGPPGQLIQAGTTAAFVVSNTSTVWVQGHVYDKDLTSVRVGDKVDMRRPSFPDTFHGEVSYVGDMLDPATRTTPVRIVTKNHGGFLKKDQFVNVVSTTRSTHECWWSQPPPCSTTTRTCLSSTSRSSRASSRSVRCRLGGRSRTMSRRSRRRQSW